MHDVLMLRKDPHFLSIPIEEAMYCSQCDAINNSTQVRCGRCGCESLSPVAPPTANPPDDPGPGPAPALAVFPTSSERKLRAA